MTAIQVIQAATALPSNIRLNYAEPIKKKDSALMRISAGLPMETTSLLPNKSTRVKRKNAMDFGTKDAVVMARDASSATSK